MNFYLRVRLRQKMEVLEMSVRWLGLMYRGCLLGICVRLHYCYQYYSLLSSSLLGRSILACPTEIGLEHVMGFVKRNVKCTCKVNSSLPFCAFVTPWEEHAWGSHWSKEDVEQIWSSATACRQPQTVCHLKQNFLVDSQIQEHEK